MYAVQPGVKIRARDLVTMQQYENEKMHDVISSFSRICLYCVYPVSDESTISG